MDELTTTCYRCGAQGATKYLGSLNAFVHHDTRRCVSALRARAEAAEKLLSAPDKVIDNMTAVISERIAAESALVAAQARIAELEAQLAAQAWRRA